MARSRRRKQAGEWRAKMVTGLALVALLLIASYALLGPTGIIAWTDYRQALSERTSELAERERRRDALRNRQRLLDRDNVDPDLAGELMRKELNVVAPDEIVIPMKNDE
jgi:cell division protein FtsB